MGCGVGKNQTGLYFVVCNFDSYPEHGDDFNFNFPIKITANNITDAYNNHNKATQSKNKRSKRHW